MGRIAAASIDALEIVRKKTVGTFFNINTIKKKSVFIQIPINHSLSSWFVHSAKNVEKECR